MFFGDGWLNFQFIFGVVVLFRKIFIFGSVVFKIGEVGEFDYFGSQVIKVVKEEGIEIVFVNLNIVMIQMFVKFVDCVYLLLVILEFVEKIIDKEWFDCLFFSFGGQIVFNCGFDLYD